MKNCPISDLCQYYSNGSKRRGHHIRMIEPCKKFLSGECECAAYLQWWLEGKKGISCRIDKHKGVKND